MTTTSTDPASLRSTAEALVSAFVSGGKVRPALPAGRRAEVVGLLTRLVVSPPLLDAYCAAVTAERERQGVHRLLLVLGDEPIPDAIVSEGFGGLSDEQLADIATDANAVRAIAGWLSDSPDVEPGDWYIDACLREQAGQSAAGTRHDGTGGAVRAPEPSSASPGSVRHEEQPGRHRLVRWVVPSLGLAASLLLGFILGMQMRGVEPDLDATGARVTPGGALGGQAWTIDVPSDRRAFVTIALFGPNNIPEYYPESGKFLEAQPGKPLRYTTQANAGDSLFVILTETPATDVLNNVTATAVNTRQQTWRDADSFRDFLETTLRSLGFRHFAVRRIVLTR